MKFVHLVLVLVLFLFLVLVLVLFLFLVLVLEGVRLVIGGSGDAGRHQLSHNICFDKLTVVHLVHLVLVLVSVGVR